MKISQAERLNKVLKQDKSLNPQRFLPALKSDMRDILREYGELDGDVTIDIQETIEGYNVLLLAKMIRFR